MYMRLFMPNENHCIYGAFGEQKLERPILRLYELMEKGIRYSYYKEIHKSWYIEVDPITKAQIFMDPDMKWSLSWSGVKPQIYGVELREIHTPDILDEQKIPEKYDIMELVRKIARK